MARLLNKWKAIFIIWLQDAMTYRASLVIWILPEALNGMLMPLVWIAAGKGQAIAGFEPSQFVQYYLVLLTMQGFVVSHMMWDIAFEIKDGIYSVQMLRPISYFQFQFFRNLAWRANRTIMFLPFLACLVLFYQSYLHGLNYYWGVDLWISVLLGNIVSFSFVLAMAQLAFFVQEAQALFEFYYFPMIFLSGQAFPIAVMPSWVRSLSPLFPFYYTTGVPTEIAIGKLSGPAAHTAMGIQVVWIAISLVMYKILMKTGLPKYSGVGM
ncbi:MAG: ABC-2 family transporter protein [Armatimonadetes bacterium]|nr:ABC-2 family transporter protein [Armatimonadota bacterium]